MSLSSGTLSNNKTPPSCMNSARASPTQLMKGQTMTKHIVTLRPLEQAYPAWMKEVSPSGTRSKDGAACYDYEGEVFRFDY